MGKTGMIYESRYFTGFKPPASAKFSSRPGQDCSERASGTGATGVMPMKKGNVTAQQQHLCKPY
jgi:hypothetical protein